MPSIGPSTRDATRSFYRSGRAAGWPPLGSGVSIWQLFDSYALGSAEQQEHAKEVVGGRPFSPT